MGYLTFSRCCLHSERDCLDDKFSKRSEQATLDFVVPWNPINLATNGPQKSGCISMATVFNRLLTEFLSRPE